MHRRPGRRVAAPDRDGSVAMTALRFHNRGFIIAPVHGATAATYQDSKRPVAKGWQSGIADVRVLSSVQHYGFVLGSGEYALDPDTVEAAALLERTIGRERLQAGFVARGGRGHDRYIVRLPDGERLPGTFPGGDIKTPGSLLVIHSQWGKRRWRVVNDAEPLTLTPAECAALRALNPVTQPRKRPQSAQDARHTVSGAIVDNPSPVDIYKRIRASQTRNNALYLTVKLCRENGYNAAAIDDSGLLDVFASDMTATAGHVRETVQQRIKEGRLTIASGFRAKLHRRLRGVGDGLSNAARERLLGEDVPTGEVTATGRQRVFKRGQVARALDALYTLDMQPGTILTAAQLQTTLQAAGIEIGNRTAQRIVKDELFADGVPSPADVAAMLDCDGTLGDGVSVTDCTSMKAYKRALQRGLITRRPGLYTKTAMAARLGVSRATLNVYNRELGVVERQRYRCEALQAWAPLPDDPRLCEWGTWVEAWDYGQQRYVKLPPHAAATATAYKRGLRHFVFVQRLKSYYKLENALINTTNAVGVRACPPTPIQAALVPNPPREPMHNRVAGFGSADGKHTFRGKSAKAAYDRHVKKRLARHPYAKKRDASANALEECAHLLGATVTKNHTYSRKRNHHD